MPDARFTTKLQATCRIPTTSRPGLACLPPCVNGARRTIKGANAYATETSLGSLPGLSLLRPEQPVAALGAKIRKVQAGGGQVSLFKNC